MFFATTAPASLRRHAYSPAGRSLERFLEETQLASRQKSCAVAQDEKSYTLTFDVPGIAKDQLNIGIEGCIVRIETKEGAARQYKQAYELPQDIDAASSEAKLENGVLTLKLGKQAPVSRVTALTIN
ncbi:Hsp20/alpha crystallin family protein [Rhodoferax sp. UBA5149]|uniref:Hsp20/alpha crystallin family protein n=1 Tax=Rhodoferax sp. UBA5149 TaxID=1947379 RepID=UPI0025FA58B7|nr:Hsp20/alpha crystallin family protein [Rhodoferax sp. UBA5149]